MAGESVTTIAGNLTADPELRYTQTGIPVCGFTVAVNERKFDRDKNEWVDGESMFMRCSVWREPAENVAASLVKGSRVLVTGKLKQRSYDDREGNARTVIELEVEEIGASLKYATAALTRATHTQGQGGNGGTATGQRHGDSDAWATPSSAGEEIPW